ncbi:hypothetical protein NDN08_008045 [Rhodosorus marinus]|uniref:Transmembrane protein n=1 Tax=Rhodosorus marinus TaxID=101924 RepID=A0AAV8V3B9_9RHOD|nr:hypothetical protein NDN08_008045 [Rhodosorus marinus]
MGEDKRESSRQASRQVGTARVRRFLLVGFLICVALAAVNVFTTGWHFEGQRSLDEVEYILKEARDDGSNKSPLERLLDEPFVSGDAARRRFIKRLTTILKEETDVADDDREDDE